MQATIAKAIHSVNSRRQFSANLFWSTIGNMETDPIRQTRVRVLRKAVEDLGGAAAFSRAHPGVDPTYISQLLNGHRAFGEKAARRMETLCSWPAGFLDGGYTNQLQSSPNHNTKALEDFQAAMNVGDELERNILLSTISTIINSHKKDERTTELPVIIERRRRA